MSSVLLALRSNELSGGGWARLSQSPRNLFGHLASTAVLSLNRLAEMRIAMSIDTLYDAARNPLCPGSFDFHPAFDQPFLNSRQTGP